MMKTLSRSFVLLPFVFCCLLSSASAQVIGPSGKVSSFRNLNNVRTFGADPHRVKAQRIGNGPTFVLKGVSGFDTDQIWPVPDRRIEHAAQKDL